MIRFGLKLPIGHFGRKSADDNWPEADIIDNRFEYKRMNFNTSLIFATLSAQLFLTGAAVAEQVDFGNLKSTPELVSEAKKHPNGWVYVITGNYGPKDAVPPEAIAGAWKVDSSGNIVPGSFQPNPKHMPKQGNK